MARRITGISKNGVLYAIGSTSLAALTTVDPATLLKKEVFNRGDEVAFSGGKIGPQVLAPVFTPASALSASPYIVQADFGGSVGISGTDTFGNPIDLFITVPALPPLADPIATYGEESVMITEGTTGSAGSTIFGPGRVKITEAV